MNNTLLILTICFSLTQAFAQSYAPAAGEPGSTAIENTHQSITSWASAATIKRGYLDIEDTLTEINGNNKASFGTVNEALGFASGDVAETVSLGDGGEVILTFDLPIVDGNGADFAVFENAFNNSYLELAFVEVSTDGERFVRFPTHSQTQTVTQVSGFGNLQAINLNNLAGKYRAGFGTPFDLSQLQDSAGIDLQNIQYIKIIDVVGSIADSARLDAFGNKINDPYPTPYSSGGFDLDGVGVINQVLSLDNNFKNTISVYPNPAKNKVFLNKNYSEISLVNTYGKVLKTAKNSKTLSFNVSAGVYTLVVKEKNAVFTKKIIVL